MPFGKKNPFGKQKIKEVFMKKRIRKHAGEAAAVIFTLLFLCGNWGNCEKVSGADVEKMELSDGTVNAELWDGEQSRQEVTDTEEKQEEKEKEDTEETPEEVTEENKEESAEEEEEIKNPLTLLLNGKYRS